MPLNKLLAGLLAGFLLSMSVFCRKSPAEGEKIVAFEDTPQRKVLAPQIIKETSGIADSRINTGLLWAIEDSGNPPGIFKIGHEGKVQGMAFLRNATNRDWEAIAVAPGKQKNTIWIGDIGDNESKFEDYYFYRLAEPSEGVDTVEEVEKLRFRYPDGSHDAEAFLIDPVSADIYIITKRDSKSKIYRLAAPLQTGEINMAEPAGELLYNGVTAACLSADGTGIIVKTYFSLVYYEIKPGKGIKEALKGYSRTLPYVIEPQGEAVSFASDNTGYFTLSEAGPTDAQVELYFYKRKE